MEESPRFGDGRTTWSKTYQRLFRSLHPDEARQNTEKQTASVRTTNSVGDHLDQDSSAFHGTEQRKFGQGRKNSSPRTETQTSKRVSINEDEARSELSKMQSDQHFSDSCIPNDMDKAIFDDDICEYVCDVVQREFPQGGIRMSVIDQDKQPIETVFNKTLRLTRNDKIVYLHLRNHIRTSIRQRRDDRAFINAFEEIVSPTSISIARSEFPRRGSNGSEHNDDGDLTNTNASSWSGPHRCLPLPTSVCSSNNAEDSYRYQRVSRNFGDDLEKCDVHLLSSSDCCFSWNEEKILRRKVERGELLNRGELLYLKKLHCARVADDEAELASLLCIPRGEDDHHVQHLRKHLDANYRAYEDILEMARPDKRAVLAYQILLADAYLFHARIKPATRKEQRKLYQRAIDIYSDLLRLARRSLSATDLSLLTIAERLALILRENRSMVPNLVVEITSLLDEAEEKLRKQSESESQMRIRRARHHLDALGGYYYLSI